MKGAIGFSTNLTSWKSRLIRWFTGSQYSHTFVLMDADEPYIVEAGKYEVRISLLTRYQSADYRLCVYRPVGVAPEAIDAAILSTIKLLGRGYGYFQIFGFAIMEVFERLGLKAKNPIRKGIICSEMVALYLSQIFPDLLAGIDQDSVSPEDILNIVKTSGKFEEWKN